MSVRGKALYQEPYGEQKGGSENMSERQRRDEHRGAVRESKTFKDKWINFWYYYKFHVIIGVILVAFLTVSIGDIFHKEKFDFSVVVATREELPNKAKKELEIKLEQCAPAREDGSAPNLEVIFCTIPAMEDSRDSDTYSAAVTNLRVQVRLGRAAIYLLDSGVMSDMEITDKFVDLAQEYPDLEHTEGISWYIKNSEFMQDENFKGVPDDLQLHFMKLESMENAGKKKKTQKSYEWQNQTLENMMNNNLLRTKNEIGTQDIDARYR